MAGSLFDKASEMLGKSVDAANDIFGKGKDVASGVFDSAGDLTKRGVIRAKMADADLEYERLMKKLGTAVYDELKNDPAYTEAHGELFAEIASCVERKQALEDELSELEASSAASRPIDVKPVPPEEADAAAESAEAGAAQSEQGTSPEDARPQDAAQDGTAQEEN